MDALLPGGAAGVAVPATAGPTAARGDPGAPATSPIGPEPVGEPGGGPPGDLTDLDEPPSLARIPPALEVRSLYPDQARRDRLEGDVLLELLVDEEGRVAAARVIAPAGHGFDPVAVLLARRLGFRPGRRSGRAVSVRIPFTWKFRLDD